MSQELRKWEFKTETLVSPNYLTCVIKHLHTNLVQIRGKGYVVDIESLGTWIQGGLSLTPPLCRKHRIKEMKNRIGSWLI